MKWKKIHWFGLGEKMTYLRISLFLCCAFVVFVWSAVSVGDLRHSAFYGICTVTPKNSSHAIYSQVINIRNNGIIQKPPRPIRRWMNSVRNIFRRRSSIITTTTVQSILSGVRISQIFTYPPFVSTEINAKRHFHDYYFFIFEHLCLYRRVNAIYIRSSAFESSINSQTVLVATRRWLEEASGRLGHGFNWIRNQDGIFIST